MYQTSQTFQNCIKSTERAFKLKMSLDTALEHFDLDDSDVIQGTLSLTESVADSSDLTIGSTVASDISFTLNNATGKFDSIHLMDAIVKPQVGLELPDGSCEWVPLGTFNVDDVGRPSAIITVQAADNMLLFDASFDNISLTFPCTALQVLQAICDYCGVRLQTTSFTNSDYQIDSRPTDSMTCRDVVSSIAKIAGCYARITRDTAELKLDWFPTIGYVNESNIDGGLLTQGKNLFGPAGSAGTLTITNIITNGNFSADSNNDGLADNFSLGNNAAAISCSSNTQVFNAVTQCGFLAHNTNLTAGHRYFCIAYIKSTSSSVGLGSFGTGSGAYMAHPGDGNYHWLYIVVNVPSEYATGKFDVYDTRTSGWDNIAVQNFMVVDMGTDGINPLYNLSADQMNRMISGYIDGTQAVSPITGMIVTSSCFVISTNNLAAGFSLNDATAVSCVNNTQTFIGTAEYGQLRSNFVPLAGHRYFLYANVKATSNLVYLCAQYGASSYTNMLHPGDGRYHVLYNVISIDSGFNSGLFYIQDTSTSGWQNISVQDFVVVEMGADASNPLYSLTAGQMKQMLDGYISGTRPDSSVTGMVSGGTVPANQVITNGNFMNGTTGWVQNNCTQSVSNGISSLTGSGSSSDFYMMQLNDTSIHSKRYFITAQAIATDLTCQSLALGMWDGSGFYTAKNQSLPKANQWYTLYGIVTTSATSTSGGNFSVHAVYADSAAASGKVVQVKNFMAVDMGVNPSNPVYSLKADLLNTIISQKEYFEGTANIGGVACTVSKDGTISLNGTAASGLWVQLSPMLKVGLYANSQPIIRLKNGSKYTLSHTVLSGSKSGNMLYNLFDTAGTAYPSNYLINLQDYGAPYTFTAGNNGSQSNLLTAGMFNLTINAGTVFNNYAFRIQLEQGGTATGWVPHWYQDGDTGDGGDFNWYDNGIMDGSTFRALWEESNVDGNTDNVDGGGFCVYSGTMFDGGSFLKKFEKNVLGANNRYDFSKDYAPVLITGIKYSSDNETKLIGADNYTIDLGSNPFLQNNVQSALQKVMNQFSEFCYLPFESNWQGNPALEPGDCVCEVDKNGTEYNSIVTDSTYVYRGSCKISAKTISKTTQQRKYKNVQ